MDCSIRSRQLNELVGAAERLLGDTVETLEELAKAEPPVFHP